MFRVFARLSAAMIFAVMLLAGINPAAGALERSAAAEYQLVASCRANDNLSEVANDFISRCRQGSIRREFPAQYLSRTLGDIKADSGASGKKAWKLLNDNRFLKKNSTDSKNGKKKK